MISKGLLGKARDHARRNIEALAPFAEAGRPVLGLEPSCLLTLRDEYVEFFPDDPRAQAVARATRLIEELLLERGKNGKVRIQQLPLRPASQPILVHNHCHAKSLVGSGALMEMLAPLGEVRETSAGCCGMAGPLVTSAALRLIDEDREMRLFPTFEDPSRKEPW
jgi:Fe-S oxidoreductase